MGLHRVAARRLILETAAGDHQAWSLVVLIGVRWEGAPRGRDEMAIGRRQNV